MTTNKNTLWIAGTGVLAVLVLLATYFLLVAPKRAEAADVATQRAGVEASNTALAQQTEVLKAQFATLDEQRAKLAEVQATLPASAQVQTLIRSFAGYATGAGLSLTQLAPGTLSDYTPAAVTATATTTTATSNIQSMPFTVTVQGSFAGSELFIKNVQADMQRFMLVNDVKVGTGEQDGQVATTLTGSVFVLKDPLVAAREISGAGAAATATTTTDAPASSTETVN